MRDVHCPPFIPMADVAVPHSSGAAELRIREVTEEEAMYSRIRAAANPHRVDATVRAGRYALLLRDGVTWMSDTPMERRTNLSLYRAAKGRVLILGLGIGMLPVALARKDSVRSITIIEIDADVIAAVTPTLEAAGVNATIIHGDAFLPEHSGLDKDAGFDSILADIWPTICSDDYVEHIAVRRAWRPWLRQGGVHATWLEHEAKAEFRRDRDEYNHYRHSIRGAGAPLAKEPTAAQQATILLREKRAAAKEGKS